MKKALPSAVFWSSRSVVLTGYTGFKGCCVNPLSNQLGAEICGFSVCFPTHPSCYAQAKSDGLLANDRSGDVTDFSFASEVFPTIKPDAVFHLAAQPLALFGYEDPLGTFRTNTMETVNILEVSLQVKCVEPVIVATTGKMYQNKETRKPYTQGDELGGTDPYSASRAPAELVAAVNRGLVNRPVTKIATDRAGNVIGAGDWSPSRLLSDQFAAMDNRSPVGTCNSNATRPWQQALEALIGYLLLAEASRDSTDSSFPASWNFGPSKSSVQSARRVSLEDERVSGRTAAPLLVSALVPAHPLLALDSGQSKSFLRWNPRCLFEDLIRAVVRWHDNFLKGHHMNQVSNEQIATYMDGRCPV